MELKDWLPPVIQFIIALGTLVGAWPLIKRVNAQNQKDNVDALKVAMDLAGMDVMEQLELRKEVKHLKDVLEQGKRYKVCVIFRVGEKPIIEESILESLPEDK